MSRRRRLTFTTRLDPDHSPAPDMVNRQFVADGPNQPSLAGMTCIPTWQGLIYLKTVVDVWSGRVVGWSIGEHMHAEPVFSALDMALGSREPKNLIHHGDQRSQYVTLAFGKRCWEMGVPPPPMDTVGDAYDKTMAGRFFACPECEKIDRRTLRTKTEARLAVFTWIKDWYNSRRRHSAPGNLSPMNYEEKHRGIEQPHDKPGLPTGPQPA